MISHICTTKEQSQRLQKLGFKRNTADMYWPLASSIPEVCDKGDYMQADTPAWSLGSLINLMPAMIMREDYAYFLSINKNGVVYATQEAGPFVLTLQRINNDGTSTLIENCVKMIEWLVKHKLFEEL